MNAPAELKAVETLSRREYQQIDVRFDAERGIAWTYMNPSGVPCFNLGLLNELRAHDAAIEASGGCLLHEGRLHPIHYYVGASKIANVFNLGGDLALFVQLVKSQDRGTLMHYAKLCVDNMYPRIRNYSSPMTTISLVQGEALGGGFEIALSSNVIIAETHARFGFPEILFNLFPGMGAYSLLGRRIGMKRAEEMILSGRVFTAAELHEIGVIDVLAEDGAGEAAVREFVDRHDRHRSGMQAMFDCRQHFHPVSYEELMNITTLWVDAAMRLEEKDLKLMSRLARSQFRRIPGGASSEMPEAVLDRMRSAAR